MTAKSSRTIFSAIVTPEKMVRVSFKAYGQLPGILRLQRQAFMLEDPYSPSNNRFCSCECSRYLRLVGRSSRATGLIQVAKWS